MIYSECIAKLAAALSKAQGEIKGAKKDTENPFFKAKYADLESTWEACREPLSKNGLSVVQMPYSRDGRIGIETMLLHDGGGWIKGEIDVKMSQETNPQNAGSILTYLRRYSLQGAVGIAPEDDDANAAVPKASPTPQTEKKPEPEPDPEKKDLHTLINELHQLAEIAVDAGMYKDESAAIFGWTSYRDKKSGEIKGFKAVSSLKHGWQAEGAITRANDELNSKLPPVKDGDIPS